MLLDYWVAVQGEDEDQYFPPYHDLPTNYQTPIKVLTDIYNDDGQKRSQKIESRFDDYGNSVEFSSYLSDTNTNAFMLISTEKTTYYSYDKEYGQVRTKELYDYTKDTPEQQVPIVRRSLNTLTSDSKNIATTTNGFVESNIFKPSKKSTFEYDSCGRSKFEKLEWNDGEEYSFESTETFINFSVADTVLSVTTENPQHQSIITKIDTTTGWIISKINAAGEKTSYTYDNLGRKRTETDPLGVTTTWVYDDSINKMTTTYANGYETYTYYDGFGNQIKMADNLSLSERVLGIKTYNNKGQLILEEGILGRNSRITYQYNPRGQVETATDALGNVTKYVYDPVAQTTTTYFNNNKITEAQNNQNITNNYAFSTVSPSTKIETTEYSNSYEKVTRSIVGKKTSSSSWTETVFDFDADLNIPKFRVIGSDGIIGSHTIKRDLFTNPCEEIIDITLPDGTTSRAAGDVYIYNNLNQLIKERNALGQTYEYTYNDAGMQVTYKDYAGTLFTSTYNANNQVTSVAYTDKSENIHEKRFTYYPLTHQLKSIEDFCSGLSKGAISYTYTPDNKLASKTYPDGKSVQLEYDVLKDCLTQFTDAIGQKTKYYYDDYGRLIKSEILGTAENINITYYTKEENPANSGKIKTVTNSDGVQNIYTYDGFGAVETLIIKDTKLNSSNILAKMEYSYTYPSGNVARLTYSSNAFPSREDLNYSVEYTYNSLNQLLGEKVSALSGQMLRETKCAYDAANNVTQEDITDSNNTINSTTYTYDEDNKLLKISRSSGTTTLTYDKNGNLIDDGAGSTFTYDEKNNLIGYKNEEIEVFYTYYPDGLRATKKTIDNHLIQFYYDGAINPNIVNEIQLSKKASYLMVGGKRYTRFVQTQEGIQTQYFVDNLKDTIGILNKKSAFEKVYRYSPYGQQDTASAITFLDIQDNPFEYTNEYTDCESGLIYLRTRYYNPAIKRFISRDAVTLINRYAYADGNPVMHTDPSGQFSWEAFGAILGGVAAIAGGIALTVATAGAATPVLVAAGIAAGALIGAGASSAIYGATHTTGDFDAKDWGVMTGIGAAFGAVGGAFGTGIGAAGWSAARTLAADVAFNTALGAADGYVTNGAINANHGTDFNEGAGAAAGFGALAGGISSAALGALGRGVAIANSRILKAVGRRSSLGVGQTRGGISWLPHSIVRVRKKVYEQVIDEESFVGWDLLKSTIRMRPLRTVGQEPSFPGGYNPGRAHEVSLSIPQRNASNARELVDNRIDTQLGRYDLFTNSCTSNVVDVLQAANFKVPLYARTPWTLHFWAKRLAAGTGSKID